MAAPVIAPPPPEASPSPTDPSGVPIDSFGVPRDNLFVTYNPHGAAGGLFAPAYIHGYAPSEQAVADWQGQRGGLTHEMVANDLLMPDAWKPPAPQEQTRGGGMVDASSTFPGDGVYGGSNIPRNLTLGKNPNGTIDTAALRALSHGTAYDVQGRRDAIAARLLANQQAQDEYNKAKPAVTDMTRSELAASPNMVWHPADEHGGSGYYSGIGDW
jgi:hypothetical protein